MNNSGSRNQELSPWVMGNPIAFARWLSGADFAVHNAKQVAIVGDLGRDKTKALLAEIRSSYRPNMVVAQSPYPIPEDAPELLKDRALKNDLPTAYVCEGFACKLPVNSADELREQLFKQSQRKPTQNTQESKKA